MSWVHTGSTDLKHVNGDEAWQKGIFGLCINLINFIVWATNLASQERFVTSYVMLEVASK